MKKVLILSLSLVLVVGVGVIIINVNKVEAEDTLAPQIVKINTSVKYNKILIDWQTDEYTNGKVEYGKNSGNYSNTVEDTINIGKQYHYVNIADLEYSTTYYFRVVATDLAGNKTNSAEQTFTTESNDLTFTTIEFLDVSDTYAVVYAKTNKNSFVSVKYGTSSNNYVSETGSLGGLCAIAPCNTEHPVIFTNLRPNTKYYYKIHANHFPGMGEPPIYNIDSQEFNFTTTSTPVITSIDPAKGSSGTEITITGKNFGSAPLYGESSGQKAGRVEARVGCGFDTGYLQCNADVLSWSDTQIVIKTTDSSKTGPVFVSKQYGIFASVTPDLIINVQGPTFTVSGSKPTNVNAPTVSNYITNAYGCDFSTSKSDDNTIRVSTLFTKDSDTDKYLSQVYNLYQENWGRVPRCSELQFHLDHSTPIARLTEWLENQAITNKYGCDFSTTVSNENTILVKTLFTLDSSSDKYLNEVYNAYYENWGRYPRCTEMQFHLDHFTPIDRLTNWLKENKPTVTNVNAAPTELVTEKIEFKEVDNKVVLKDETQELKIEQNKQLTFTGTTAPNAFVVLTINSEPTIATTVSNDKGEWSYTLPGPLELGEHTVKIAVSDKGGQKVSESDVVEFSIVSGAKTVIPASITEFVKDNTTTWLVGIVVVGLIVIVIVYFLARKKPQIPPGPKK